MIDSSDGERHDYTGSDGCEDTEEAIMPSETYHLKVDPNVPISVQFHTYTSYGTGVQPMAAMAPQSERISKAWNQNRSTKRSAQNVGNVVINNMDNNSIIRPSIHAINKNNNFSVNNTSNANNKMSRERDNRDHSSYSRHREMHKTLEKNRRAHLRHCFEVLKDELPPNEYNEKKSSHINIISCAIRYIQHLKRTETELHYQTERLVRTKIRFQSQIAQLVDDLKEINSNSTIAGIGPIIEGDHTLTAHFNDSHYKPPIDEQSDEEVIIELQNGDDCYDDETTTTASGLSS